MKAISFYYRTMVFGKDIKWGEHGHDVLQIKIPKEFEILEHSGPLESKQELIEHLMDLYKKNPSWKWNVFRIEKVLTFDENKNDGTPIQRSSVVTMDFFLEDSIKRLSYFKRIK